MNRAPSKNDTWWAEHQRTCGGTYTKIKEPEDYGKKKGKEKDKEGKDKEKEGKEISKKGIIEPSHQKTNNLGFRSNTNLPV